MKFSSVINTYIIIPESVSPTERFAAEELQKYLNKIFCINAEICTSAEGKSGNIISIGGPERNAYTAKFISEKDLTILLKCRVIRVCQRPDGVYDVTVQTNEGLTHLFAKQVLDATDCSEPKQYTVLFVCDCIDPVREQLESCFEGARIEPTAYENRYALHFVVCADTDENRIKLDVYHKWQSHAINAKILYMAPVFYGNGSGGELCDGRFDNPIEAFEAGYLYGKEQANVSIDA